MNCVKATYSKTENLKVRKPNISKLSNSKRFNNQPSQHSQNPQSYKLPKRIKTISKPSTFSFLQISENFQNRQNSRGLKDCGLRIWIVLRSLKVLEVLKVLKVLKVFIGLKAESFESCESRESFQNPSSSSSSPSSYFWCF